MPAELPPDVRDRAARAAQLSDAGGSWIPVWDSFHDENREYWRAVVDAVAAVVLGEDVIVLSKADAAWLCDVLHGEGQTEREYNRAHQLLEGSA